MRAFVLLLKIQLLGLFGINKALHVDAARAKRAIGLVALAAVALVAIVAAYVVSAAETLVSAGFVEYVPLMAVLVGAVAGAVAAFLKANGVLFAFKDYDLVMSLPVPTATVVLSRIASLYAMGAAFGLLVMVPAFAVYALHAGVSAMGVVCMALAVALAPLAPLALAVVLAALVAAASSRFRHASIFQVVLTMVLLLAFLAVYFLVIGQSGGDVNQFAAMGAQGEILGCMTALTGELLDALTHHTILADAVGGRFVPADGYDPARVRQGLEAALAAGLGRAAFAGRTLRTLGGLSAADAANYLLGAALSQDVLALRAFSLYHPGDPLYVCGKPPVQQALCDALRAAGLDAVQGVDGALGREMGVRGARIIHGGMSR